MGAFFRLGSPSLPELFAGSRRFTALDVVEIVVAEVNLQTGIRPDAILDYGFRQWIFNVPLNCSAKRARTIRTVLAGLVHDPLSDLRAEHDRKLLLFHDLINHGYEEIHDLYQIVIREGVKENDLIQAVQEFRIEYLFYFAVDQFLRPLGIGIFSRMESH